MKSKNLIIFSLLVIVFIFLIVVLIGFFKNKKEQKIPSFIESPQQTTPTPIPAPVVIPTQEVSTLTPLNIPQSQETQVKSSNIYPPLFNKKLIYIDLDYPLLYVYDPQDEVIKYINLEDETYKEIVKIKNDEFKNAWMSEDKTKIVFLANNSLKFIDLKTDNIYKLNIFTKNFIFTPDLWLYINDDKYSYISKFEKGKLTKIRDLGILNPEFVNLKDLILIYEKNSPLFSLTINKPYLLKIFLEGQFFDVLTNKNKDLLFVTLKENEKFQSKVIDLKGNTKYSFLWQTHKEKCSFDDVLICAVPVNFNPDNLDLFLPVYDEKIIIFDVKNNEIKEINLKQKFNLIKPKLTPKGIIAFDKLTSQFYLFKLESQ